MKCWRKESISYASLTRGVLDDMFLSLVFMFRMIETAVRSPPIYFLSTAYRLAKMDVESGEAERRFATPHLSLIVVSLASREALNS